MSDIVKICKVHGNLIKEQTYTVNRAAKNWVHIQILCRLCNRANNAKWQKKNYKKNLEAEIEYFKTSGRQVFRGS